ncbi:NAD(P)/FAD-dependent oxidoreductase [Enterococcus saccharolyticus]|uniref:Flavoprotein n=1 Tax=Enterococcus saccharolyticus subsp. saccharolyticus ATCC 43076 TaxID=1139996 RepID=S0NKZ8_9ENTE|nr:NAD(P)/FAD-dependent oxidoreductase [Enterococcus saccharolyticus]EOT27875.1 flavoprotein [Enterococcus saccharolyticus subsp. saccharolyticus ATCC 43076]EOT77253.1 flavoprotein [Enterococcus saccharolyticus subsp. saccharolyticus ATCC 43076]OJG87432.1 flavoprotein [Enterococcus saccharolyticus]
MESTYDVIVVGGGTSGLMAAIAAAESNAKVLLIEKNKRFGKKLLMTGGGRCNVTNNRMVDDLIHHIPGNGKFLYSTFAQFNNQDIMNFFESQGVSLKEEDHGRMFPVSNKSKTIVDTLVNRVKELGVTIATNTVVKKLLHETEIKGVETEFETFYAPCVVLTTGGRTYPSTGSTGDGYKLAKKVGHTIAPLYPTESPLISEEDFICEKTLQGISLRDICLSVLNEQGKSVTSHKMDLLFTHFGVSGPAALRCSSFVNQLLETQEQVAVSLDCFPDISEAELTKQVQETLKDTKKVLKNALLAFLPERLLHFYLEKLELADLPANQLTEEQLAEIIALWKDFQIQIVKTFPLEKSFVTGGGINLKEINPKTMESKVMPGLFFGGELIDINGYTGGFNITAAFCTGHSAGKHAAEIASYFHY